MLLTAFMQSLLQGGQRFVRFNGVILVQYAAPTVCIVLAVLLFPDKTLGAVTAWTVSAAVTAASAAYTVAPLRRFSLRLHRSTLRTLLRFGSLSYLGNLTAYVNYRFDVLIVNLFAGVRQVGLYAVGASLAEVVWFVTNAAALVLAPRVASGRTEDADRVTEAVARVVALLTLAAAIALAIMAPFAVVLFFGADFAESTWAVWLLLPGIVTFSVSRILSMYLLGRNKLKIDLMAATVGLAVTLVLDFLLIPVYGFRGAAVASSIAYTSAMLVNLVWVVRHSTITPANLLVARPADLRMLLRRLREAGLAGPNVLSNR
jgi:O-antigen/teichoic acid export membrane protein